ncbi:GNAT family N-acetyltransferase [Actinocatenispora sera]|uniref:Acetyltransferase n=1 Tax=Actinocatenispora sera TaxID=390989 RepID=A0A810L7J4_9ACTN|nr:GNAT family N-acetyltransferase [Actinocatenispora sera]BCJ31207.1 acetyltransferase [Actinocatenispora sera]
MQIRRLTSADVPACQELSADRGWLREDRRWALLIELAEVYGIDAADGGLAGAVTLTRYDTHAAIGMMLVAARYERQGFGRALMSRALAAAGGPVCLRATDNGRPLYEQLGFATDGSSVTYVGTLSGPRPDLPPTRPAWPTDLPEILRLDADAFGADRSRLLRRLAGFGRLRIAAGGYGASWRNGAHNLLGPVVADDVATAMALCTDLADGPIRLDISSYQPEFEAWAADRLERGARVSLMSTGGTPPGDVKRLFTPFTVATD